MNINLRLLGVGAVEINAERRILIDAFNSVITVPRINDNDIFLFTHDDFDHFAVEKIPDIRGSGNIIIGPPSIVLPIIKNEKADINQLIIEYPKNNEDYKIVSIDNIEITFFPDKAFYWMAPDTLQLFD